MPLQLTYRTEEVGLVGKYLSAMHMVLGLSLDTTHISKNDSSFMGSSSHKQSPQDLFRVTGSTTLVQWAFAQASQNADVRRLFSSILSISS